MQKELDHAYIKLASEIASESPTAAEKLMSAANNMALADKYQTCELRDSELCCLQALFFSWVACTGPFMCLIYDNMGLSKTELGAVFFIGGLVAQILSPSVGLLTDRASVIFGPRARFACMAICMLMASIGYSLSFWPLPGVPLLLQILLCRILIELKHPAMAILDAITQRVMEERYGNARSYGALCFSVMGIIIGVLQDNFGIHAMQWWILLPMLAFCLALLFVGSPPSLPAKNNGQDLSTHLCPMIRNYGSHHTKVSFFMLASFIWSYCMMTRGLIFLYFRKLQLSFTQCGLSILSSVSIEIPMLYYSKAILDRFRPECIMTLGGILAVLHMACYTVVSDGMLLLLLEPLHGMIFASWKIPSMQILHSMTPFALQASGQTFFTMVVQSVASFAILISSYIIASFGEITLWAAASSVMALTVGLNMASTFIHALHK